MGMMSYMFWPFGLAFVGAIAIVSIIILALWIWLLVDCSKRNFKNKNEKIIWIVIIVLMGWVGALLYYILIRSLNPKGLAVK